MQTLTYSSNPRSRLNCARLALWCAKYMLGAANQEPKKYCKSFWMGRINRERAKLRAIAREMRNV